ncbi:leucine-rich_repeat domain-containing protein [Hexamita inflata]|uniref:Leucine-rich repeat domain-containing protein n=1 Tax=Hexamita inflata TaxID=28002 RepID=A0AA86PW65_9EUKA|nr:leucine-rich repeat domain-containing protein [Hexamita inflata]CAI9947116.1 leucine-rich repeat domain-containing protein [Hexamita inflata]
MEQIIDNEKFYCVRSDTNLADKQIDNIANLKVNQLYYPSISQIPVHITKLIASGCCLQEISGVRLMNNLSYLDISNNFIKNISDLQYLQNLQYLNMTNNKIIFSQPLSALPKLQQLILTNNMIHDFDALATNPNFNINWICPQNIAQIRNFLDYLGTKSTVEQATVLMTQTISRRDQSPYYDPIILKYAPQVINNTLVIHNDQELRSVQFTDLMNIETLFVFECYNLSFERVPTKIKKLAVNMCYIENINEVENMKSVVELSLRGNRISEIGVLSRMNQLQKLDIAQNNLESIRDIEKLINLTDVDLNKNYLSDISSLMSMKQLKSVNLSKNKITLAEDLQSLTNLITLNLSYNNFKSINFVKHMKNLIHLDASFNQITDIDVIKNLVKLVDLRLDGNKIESFGAIESLPNFKWSWYVSEQNVLDSDQIRIVIKDCVNKPQATISDNQQIKSFGFLDFCKTQQVSITNCPNVSFENCPHISIKLQINQCRLQTITGIFEMQQIVDLDLGFNNIRHINELEALINLQVLNLQNNDIYRINVLKNLKKLKSVNLTNNKVIFSQPLNHMESQHLIDNNIVTDNVALNNQNIPQLEDYQNFLGPNSTENQVKELAKINSYNVEMYFRFINSIVNNALQIQNDQTLNDFGFTSEMNIHTLNIQNCQNVKLPFQTALKYLKTDNSGTLINYPDVVLLKAPNQITSLTINNCKLTNIVGIENMKQLQYLNLKDNQIVLIEQLQRLTSLKQVLVENNYIQDLKNLTSQNWICEQKVASDANLQAYLTDTNSSLTLDTFKAQIAPQKAKSDQLVALLIKYDNDMCSKYQAVTTFQTLYVENDNAIKDLKFVDKLDLVEIILSKCTNISFRRTPSNLQYLSLQDCDISDLSGLQYFAQLKKLQITNSPLRSLSHISALVNLLSLQITGSKLTNVVGVNNLTKLQYLDLSENAIISIQPLSQLLQTKQFKQLYLDDNFIVDQEWLVQNYSEWICRQRVPVDSDYQNYITDVSQNINVAQLKSSFTPLITKSNQLIQDYVVKYEQEMKAKYQSQIQKNPDGYGDRLYCSRDDAVRDLKFMKDLGVTDLYIQNCPNVRKMPRNLRMLQFYDSNLKTVKCVERATNLEKLCFNIGNQIVNANGLRALNKLKYLNLIYNKVMDLNAVDYLKAKGCFGSGLGTSSQTQPSQQEIDESRLW